MKSSRVIILIAIAAGSVALVWQAVTIHDLRTKVAGLRKDLDVSLGNTLDSPTSSVASGPARREKLELVRLRHQVRELNDKLLESHARERSAGLRSLVAPLLPNLDSTGPWKFRPEWQRMEAHATNQYAQAMLRLAGATNEFLRYLTLDRAAKMSLAVGRTKDACQFATDLLVLDQKFRQDSPAQVNGDAVHQANIVLGTLALDEGRIEDAKRHLLAAGQTTGSPVLGSFGPNMSLAKELLERSEPEAVLQYLDLCRKFWGSGAEKLDEWTKKIEAGQMPEFGSNLIY